MFFVFVSVFSLFFKWMRLIFVLISLELLILSLFCYFSLGLSELSFFFFMVFSVVSSVFGMVVMVGSVKIYGVDMVLF